MIGTGRARAQAPADLEAVHPRQHHVEHDEVEGLLGEARERLAAVGRLHDLVAVALQRERQQRLDRLLVVDQQDARGSVCHDLRKASEDSRRRYPRIGARRPRLPGRVPAGAGRAVRRRVLARGPPAPARARCRPTRSTPAARSGRAAARDSLLASSAGVPEPRARARRATTRWPTASRDTFERRTRLRRHPARRPRERHACDGKRRSRRWSASGPGCRAAGSSCSPTATRAAARGSPSCPAPPRCSSSRALFKARELRKTLVLVSTSGGSAGSRARARGRASRRPAGRSTP